MKEHYIKQVKKELLISRKQKNDVLRDLDEVFTSAMEHGETEQQVIERLGSPKDFAISTEEQLGIDRTALRKRNNIIFIIISIGVSVLAFVLFGTLYLKPVSYTHLINQQKSVDHVDTPTEALAVSIGEKASVDLPFMAELLDRPGQESEIAAELSGVIFQNPAKSHGNALAGWETADEYLSGNVRKKLEEARKAADRDPSFAVNVSALEKSQPKELGAAEIDVRIGATWIDPSYYTQFIYELLKTPGYLRGDTVAVSYTHLDVYKRQYQNRVPRKGKIPTPEEFIRYAANQLKQESK